MSAKIKKGIGLRLAEIRNAVAKRQTKKFTAMICTRNETVTETTVGDWIKGKHYPQINFAMRAVRLYGKSLDWLFTGEDPPRPWTVGAAIDKVLLTYEAPLRPTDIGLVPDEDIVRELIRLIREAKAKLKPGQKALKSGKK